VALAFLVLITLAAIFAPYLTQYSPEQISPRSAFSAPFTEHFLGSDDLGRDTWSRLLYGSRVSLAVGFSAMALSILIGIVIGSLSGFFGGWLDALLMRTTDAMMSLPRLFLLLLILTLFGGDLWTVIMVIGITSWMGTARIVRGEFLRWKQSTFVEASSAMGATDSRIIVRHILPQVISSLIVTATFGVAQAILIESAMSFLGLGVQPPTPTWGNMLTNAQNYIWTAPLQALFPGLFILLTVLAFNFAGDGLRDALDPKQAN
jgi:peptide/nickel transport system permease protein